MFIQHFKAAGCAMPGIKDVFQRVQVHVIISSVIFTFLHYIEKKKVFTC